MGAWGTGVYDNDDAADWAHELEAGGIAAVEAALGAAGEGHYLDSYECAVAIAAADVVARLRDGGGESTTYAEAVTRWVAANPSARWQHLLEPARVVVARATDRVDNELFELWADSGSLDEWLAVVAEIGTRLGSDR